MLGPQELSCKSSDELAQSDQTKDQLRKMLFHIADQIGKTHLKHLRETALDVSSNIYVFLFCRDIQQGNMNIQFECASCDENLNMRWSPSSMTIDKDHPGWTASKGSESTQVGVDISKL